MVKQEIQRSRSLWLDYVIIGVLVLMSGTPVVMGGIRAEAFTVMAAVFLVIVLLFRKEPPFMPRFVVVVSVLAGILIIQCITFDFWPFHTMIGFMLRLFIGYAAVHLVKEFPKRYIRFMFCLCLISFCFHPFAILREAAGINLIQYFEPVNRLVRPYQGINVVVHHFMGYGKQLSEDFTPNPLRNGSCFWEPSVFSAYLVLAIVLLGITKSSFEKRQYRRILAVLVIALLTTMSTAGYALLPLCLLFHVRDLPLTRKQVPILLGFALLVAIFSVVAYRLDFVGGEMKEHLDEIAYRETGWETQRFGSFVYNLEYIKQRPFFGWGLNYNTRFMDSSGVAPKVTANGLADFAAVFGLVGLLTALTAIWWGMHQFVGRKWMLSILFLLFVVMELNGDRLLQFSTYLGLMFLEPMPKNRYSILGFESSAITGYKEI